MFARVSVFQGKPEEIDEGVADVREQVLPVAAEMPGYQGIYLLVDRESGRSVSITLWESEAALRESEEAASGIRTASAERAGEQILSVDRYEVVIAQAPATAS